MLSGEAIAEGRSIRPHLNAITEGCTRKPYKKAITEDHNRRRSLQKMTPEVHNRRQHWQAITKGQENPLPRCWPLGQRPFGQRPLEGTWDQVHKLPRRNMGPAQRPPDKMRPGTGQWDQAARQEVTPYRDLPLWTEWQTGIKILPWPKLRLQVVKMPTLPTLYLTENSIESFQVICCLVHLVLVHKRRSSLEYDC